MCDSSAVLTTSLCTSFYCSYNLVNLDKGKDNRMSILQADSYAVIRLLVNDVKELSTEERSHILWYACDGGDIYMVKSVIRAGCDVDHCHKGHTPLMMASIRGHDKIVKELILAECKVDQQSKVYFVSWLQFIVKLARAWPDLVVWTVSTLFSLMVFNVLVHFGCYLIYTIVIAFFNEPYKMLQIKSSTKVMALVGTVVLAILARTETGMAVVAVTVAVVGLAVWVWSKAEKETQAAVALIYVVVGIGTVTVVVAVAVAGFDTVVLTMLVAMLVAGATAGTGAAPSAVALLIIVAITVAGVMGLVWRPMLLAILIIAMPILGTVKKMSALSGSGMTALHYAAWYDHIRCGRHLVEAGANVLTENPYFRTPSHICSHRFRTALKQALSSSPKRVVAVIGNSEYGKSTLIAALQSESRTEVQSFVIKFSRVNNITQRTAGIEAVPFSSAKYGEILFYDFAGQSDYHGPHQPFLEAMLSKPGVPLTLLLLVKVTERQDVITQQLIRWLQPVILASTKSVPEVIVVGSFLDQVKSKKAAQQKLKRCFCFMQKEYPSLKALHLFLLDCREPESTGIKGLHGYLQKTQPSWSTLPVLSYNIHWVMAQLHKSFCGQSLQLNTFRVWLQDNAHNLPPNLPEPKDVCQDLSAAGCILFLHNKHDPSQSWLILDLQTILHDVYGTLFSPSQNRVNQFGLLHCTHLTKLFPKLDSKMIQEVLVTLEFCIRIDPLLLKEEILSLTEKDEVDGWLYFPALVSAEACEIFEPDPQCRHWACWQLKTDDRHIILAHLLQGIILGIAATQVFIDKKLPSTVRKHCCSVWVNGLSWGSTTGVDAAVQISDGSMVQVIGRSREEPGELYQYISNVTQCTFRTIAKLSPTLKATPYIIHPYKHIGVDESQSSPDTRYPLTSIICSIDAGHKYVHSLPITGGTGSKRVKVQELFGGWLPSLNVVQHLTELQNSK